MAQGANEVVDVQGLGEHLEGGLDEGVIPGHLLAESIEDRGCQAVLGETAGNVLVADSLDLLVQ